MSKFLVTVVFTILFFTILSIPINAQTIDKTKNTIGFTPEQTSSLTTTYTDGVWSFGSKVNVSISFLNKGVRTAISAFSRSAGSAKFAEVMVKEKDLIHWGLNITNLPLGLANQLNEVTFKIDTKEKIEYQTEYEPAFKRNVTTFFLPSLNFGFTFDDLLDAGFMLNVTSNLDISVLNVKGKTSLLLDPITYSSPSITVTGFTSGTPCTFWDLWNASNVNLWNVSWNNQNNNTQFLFSCKIVIGDGSTLTYFADKNVQVTFYGPGSAGGSNWLDVKLNATVTLGVLINAATYSTDSGIVFLFNFTSNYAYISAATGSVVDFYSCSVSGIGCISRIIGNGVRRMWNFIGSRFRFNTLSATSDLYNVYYAAPNAEYAMQTALLGTMNKIVVRGTPTYYGYMSAASTITNLDAAGATSKAFDIGGTSAANVSLINPILDIWTFNYAADATTRIVRQYTLALTVTYPNDTAFQSANVTLYNQFSTVVFSLLTNSSGQIATQTITRGFYNRTGGNTMYDYAPFTLNITSTYGNYTKIYTLTDKTNWDIALVESSSPIAVSTDLDLLSLGFGAILGAIFGGIIVLFIFRSSEDETF